MGDHPLIVDGTIEYLSNKWILFYGTRPQKGLR